MKVERIRNTYLTTDMYNRKKNENCLCKEREEETSDKPFESFLQESVGAYKEEK